MRASGREVERTARRDAEQPSLRVEHVEQREEVVLVGAAAVEEDDRAGGVTLRRARPVGKLVGRGQLAVM